MSRVHPIVALVPILFLAGCFQLKALVRVAEDGTGTLEETVLFGSMLREFMAQGANASGPPALFDEDSLRAHALRLGEGVTLVRVDTVQDGEDFGYRAVYSFRDVSALRFQFNPSPLPGRGPSRSRAGTGAMLAGTSPELAVTFGRPDAGALVVRMPRATPAEDVVEPDREAVQALADSLRRQMDSNGEAVAEMLGGIRMSLEVSGPGPVASTDASFAGDSSVVLFDYSMGALAALMREKPELVARAQLEDRAGAVDTAPILRALSARPEVRYEMLPEVTVRFAR